jgi:hypothetical protein
MLSEACSSLVWSVVLSDDSSRLVPRQLSKIVCQRSLILQFETVVDLLILSLSVDTV